MKINIFVPAALTLCLAAAPLCAQDAPAAEPPEETIPVVPAAPVAPVAPTSPNNRQQAQARKFGEDMERMMSMTPEQQAEEVRKINRQTTRLALKNAGFSEPELQDTVLQYLAEQEQAREAVRKAAVRVYMALGSGRQRGAEATSTEMLGFINNYLAATETEKARRVEAEEALDAKTGWSDNPKLHAVLLINGYIGDAASLTADASMLGSLTLGTLAPYMMQKRPQTAPAAATR